MRLHFSVNGQERILETTPDRRLVDLLREDLGLTGVKEGCGSGECGACTVLVDGRARLSCLMLAAQAEGRTVVTIEGLEADGRLHPVQQAFIQAGAIQCGFCTPGMIMAAVDLLDREPFPSPDRIREALAGNLCRCTGYTKIVEAVTEAAASLASLASNEEIRP